MRKLYEEDIIPRENVLECFEGWLAYILHANTYKYRRHLTRLFNQCFPIQTETKIENVKKHENFVNKIEKSYLQYSPQKTLELFKRGLSIKEIANKRGIKESTVWDHFAKLIEHNQFSVWKILPKEKILLILPKIYTENDRLKEIKERVNISVTFDEINCVLASVKCKNKKRNIVQLSSWYQKNYCFRKCYLNKDQRKACKFKFDILCSGNPAWELTRKEFLHLFNNYLEICVLPEPDKKKYVTWNEFNSKFR